MRGGSFERAAGGEAGSIPILKSKGNKAQTTIEGKPDEVWKPKPKPGIDPKAIAAKMQDKAGHLLVTAGQDTAGGRLAAVAQDTRFVGNGWMPVGGLSFQQAQAVAVVINSTLGRLQLMRSPGRKLTFPSYSANLAGALKLPNIQEPHICNIFTTCWELTRNMEVPQYRDGECEVRWLWDEAASKAMGWDPSELERLRLLLHREPHVRGLGYGQYADEVME